MNREDDELDEDDRLIEEALAEVEARMEEAPGPAAPVRMAKQVRHVFSLKIGADELDDIVTAAEAEGVSVGAYIREAALARARSGGSRDETVKEVRSKVKDLEKAVRRL
ncbi:MAG: hypothetical protein GEU75_05625 [Dehalococcoidia bacterium]|nr:hypothetical protein [Dehalococcoidia bacterium]